MISAAVPLNVTMLLAEVALKFNPLIVTGVPAFPDAGVKESMEGIGLGSLLFLHPEKTRTDSTKTIDTIFETAFNINEFMDTLDVALKFASTRVPRANNEELVK